MMISNPLSPITKPRLINLPRSKSFLGTQRLRFRIRAPLVFTGLTLSTRGGPRQAPIVLSKYSFGFILPELMVTVARTQPRVATKNSSTHHATYHILTFENISICDNF